MKGHTCTINITIHDQLSIYLFDLYTVRIKIKVIHIQKPVVLKSIDLNICMWGISKEQLVLFPLVPFLHHVYHA